MSEPHDVVPHARRRRNRAVPLEALFTTVIVPTVLPPPGAGLGPVESLPPQAAVARVNSVAASRNSGCRRVVRVANMDVSSSSCE